MELSFTSEFIRSRLMGPSAARITRELVEDVQLPAGPRILDLGCGKAVSSIELARRFPDSMIIAADLWIEPTENFATFREVGLDDRVIPIHAEAHQLPFADGYFDLIVSVDAYHYFGADPSFLDSHVARLLKTGGRLLVAVPGWNESVGETIPPEMRTWVTEDMNFHGVEWWAQLWSSTPSIEVSGGRELECVAAAWEDWLSCGNEYAKEDIPMLEADGGRYFAIVTAEAVKK